MFGTQSQSNSPFGSVTPSLASYLAEQAVSYARANPHDSNAQQQAAQYVQYMTGMSSQSNIQGGAPGSSASATGPLGQYGPAAGAQPVPSHLGPMPTPPGTAADLNPFTVGQPLRAPHLGPSYQHVAHERHNIG